MFVRKLSKIPRTVWTLGYVSLFMDLSSELVHSILPVFLVTVLGANALTVGFIEGIAEATALIVKIFSGALSDFFGRRKWLILVGYGMAALTKPLFPLASSVETVFTARFLDRIGKGVRGAPRDALIADVAPSDIRGACFGLRQSMDTVGAFLGPLAAIVLLYLYHGDMKAALWFAVVPAAITIVLIMAGVSEPVVKARPQPFRSPLRLAFLKNFSRHYWWIVVIGAVFTLARFSEAFLVLRAEQTGLSVTWIPLVMVVMSLFYALSAYPAGVLSDHVNKNYLLAAGLVLLALADLALARDHSALVIMCGVALWGLHMGFTQGILAAMVAAATPQELKGTAFGLFNFVTGLFMLLASVIAGWLWDRYGADMTFYAGAAFSMLALLLLMFHKSQRATT
ncbi:MFS transporter [Methylobacter sp. YRD-M1]|uniref:MFS transporter n=1 Tax=Methylobacter sp. YRD-M1 TaxID=2911520 RepID=UPI00227BCF7E|nr:MFS transporter [Methylobacter sp. YRD-M1]WAK04052.1 MFS transporter [Methylobacter sp. YRD-M1]